MHTAEEESCQPEDRALQLTSSVQALLQRGQVISAGRLFSAELALTQDMDVIMGHTDQQCLFTPIWGTCVTILFFGTGLSLLSQIPNPDEDLLFVSYNF